MRQRLGIYLHIPFCERKCAYCDFLSAPAGREVQRAYVEALKQEIRQRRETEGRGEGSTVFFGGGTPSVLPGDWIGEILEELRACFVFLEGAEITAECNPGTVDREKLEHYRKAGINRLSMRLQSADNQELRLLGRIHTWEEFLENFYLARELGFGNINVDLMSALPGQRREDWQETLEKVIALAPEHISAYSLMVEEGTPFYERYGEGKSREGELPEEETERQMYYDTGRMLKRAGYGRYEISNYARPGFVCRHNLSYWERTDYKGFGIGAASLLKEVRSRNHGDLDAYLNGDFSCESIQVLSRKEQLEETMFLGLRKMAGVALTEELLRVYKEVFRDLEGKGLLVRRDGHAVLTERGIDVSNYVLAEFLLDGDVPERDAE